MKICHITTWSPNSCGLTEASFNMIKADMLNEHEVYCVDTGINADLSKKNKSSIGESVDRNGCKITCEHPSKLDIVDLIVQHTWLPDHYLSRNQAPIVYINHGRPEASYLQEFQEPKYLAYSAYGSISYQPRIKKIICFWPEFKPYFEINSDVNKYIYLNYPAIDESIYSKDGIKYDIPDEKKGKINGLICDGNRRDLNRFDLFIGAYHAVKCIPGLKFHFIGLNNPINEAEQRLLSKIKEIDGVGMILPKVHHMDHFYRSMDFLYTNQKIITQIVGEACGCGLKVIADKGNKVASQTIDIKQPIQLSNVIRKLDRYSNKSIWSLKRFGEEMSKIYKEVIDNG